MKKIYIFLVFLTVLTSFSAGIFAGKTSRVPAAEAPDDTDLSLFWQTWETLENKYVDKSKIEKEKMVYGAIAGMVSAVGDPYTVFFDPNEAKKFIDDANGSFEGVGMEIGIKHEQLQVVTPLEESPAQKAGIRAGDIIVKIDGKSTTDMSTDEAVDLIRGPKNTDVTLTIYREDWPDTKDIKITRGVIDFPSVKLEMKEGGDVAYLRLYQFTEKANTDFEAKAVEIIHSPAKRIVLDLRNNPGGYLNVAKDIAGWFLKKGQVVTHEESSNEEENVDHKSEGPSLLANYPVVVLINEGSASASEILAGALRDNRGIKLVGAKSFGKGSVQQLVEFSDGSSLKVTIARWLTPKGDQIAEKGLAPDVEVKVIPEDVEKNIDAQLNKAIEIVKGIR